MKSVICIIFILCTPAFSMAGLAPTEADSAAPFSQTKFLPDISLILDMSWVSRNLDDEETNALEIPGLLRPEAAAGAGFNLNYAEMALAAVVDPYFDLQATLHLSSGGAELEEAYFSTRRLPLGLKLKAGKFLSHFGRHNPQHAHYWPFDDAPLVSRLLFGPEGLNEIGVQLTWLAPLPFFLQIGGEALRGDNEASFGREGFLDVGDAAMPGLWLGFARTSFDVGQLTVAAGLSLLSGQSRMEHWQDGDEPDAFAGDTIIWGSDLVMKLTLDSYRYLMLQAEYLSRRADGKRYTLDQQQPLIERQSGFYAEFCWRFERRWQAAIRWDMVPVNDIRLEGKPILLPGGLWSATAALEYSPTEFSRLRLSYLLDRSRFLGDDRRPLHEIKLSLNLGVGAHGAHPF